MNEDERQKELKCMFYKVLKEYENKEFINCCKCSYLTLVNILVCIGASEAEAVATVNKMIKIFESHLEYLTND